jgi:chromosome segregation ATPase
MLKFSRIFPKISNLSKNQKKIKNFQKKKIPKNARLTKCVFLSLSYLKLSEEFRLKTQLHEAQLSKAKIEKAELSADFSKERLELQRDLLEAKKNIDILLSREENLKEQVELYASQYESMAKGVDDKKNNMGQFRAQMDKLNKKLKHLEVDTAMWKDKFEESNTVVVKMNTVKAESDRELESTKKKLMAMEKLNRALQAERANLLAEAKATKNGT